jgi:hypothetical protein
MHLPRALVVLALTALVLALVPAVTQAAPTSAQPPGPSGVSPPDEPNPDPSISGVGQVGGTLTGNRGTWSSDTQLSSEWIRCATSTSGCETTGDTDLTYTLTAADAGKVIKLRVTGRRMAIVEIGRLVVDAQTGPIAVGATGLPVNVRAPDILGTLRESELVTGTSGVWTGATPITFGYAWTSCTQDVSSCVPRAGGQTYRPTAADVGRRLALVVTGSNGLGARQAVVFSGVVGKRAAALKSYRRMSPFPVLVIGGRVASSVTTITSMKLRRVPKGSIVNTSCSGRGCPYRTSRTTVRKGGTVRVKRLERRLRAGLTLVITVRQPDRIGKYVRLRLRKGTAPARVDRCVRPGSSKPISCG